MVDDNLIIGLVINTESLAPGSDILVPCEATAEPIPSITWYRNERALTSADSEKYEFTDKGLRIKNAQAVDGGSFLCQVGYNVLLSLSPLRFRSVPLFT